MKKTTIRLISAMLSILLLVGIMHMGVFAQSESVRLYSHVYRIDQANGLIKDVAPETSVEQFKQNVSSARGSVAVQAGDAAVATGTEVMLWDSATLLDRFQIVVTGDVDSSGNISSDDIITLKKHISGMMALEGMMLCAADTDGDDAVSSNDIIEVKKHISGMLLAFGGRPNGAVLTGNDDLIDNSKVYDCSQNLFFTCMDNTKQLFSTDETVAKLSNGQKVHLDYHTQRPGAKINITTYVFGETAGKVTLSVGNGESFTPVSIVPKENDLIGGSEEHWITQNYLLELGDATAFRISFTKDVAVANVSVLRTEPFPTTLRRGDFGNFNGATYWGSSYVPDMSRSGIDQAVETLYSMNSKTVMFHGGVNPHHNIGIADSFSDQSGNPIWFGDQVTVWKHENIQKFFNADLRIYIMVMDSARVAPDWGCATWQDGFSQMEWEAEEQEYYKNTKYLLQTYRGTGKTFILKNWEGDNMLQSDYSETRVQGFIDMFAARKAGVDRARREFGMDETCMVFLALEVNRVLSYYPDAPTNITESLMSQINVDLYSYSSYESKDRYVVETVADVKSRLTTAFDKIRASAPDNVWFGSDNVMLGEYGFPANIHGGDIANVPDSFAEDRQLMVAQGHLEYVYENNVQCSSFWEIFCNEVTSDTSSTLDGSNKRGFWLVRPNGTKTRTFEYFQNIFQSPAPIKRYQNYLLDFDDLSEGQLAAKTFEATSGLVFENVNLFEEADNSIFKRINYLPAYLSYQTMTEGNEIVVDTYVYLRVKETLRMYTSPDGETWTPIAAEENIVQTREDGWTEVTFTFTQPEGQRFFRVEVTTESGNMWNPLIASVAVNQK